MCVLRKRTRTLYVLCLQEVRIVLREPLSVRIHLPSTALPAVITCLAAAALTSTVAHPDRPRKSETKGMTAASPCPLPMRRYPTASRAEQSRVGRKMGAVPAATSGLDSPVASLTLSTPSPRLGPRRQTVRLATRRCG